MLDVLEHRAQQLEQAGERDRRLALDAAGRQHAHAAGGGRGVPEQGALADARFPAHDQDTTRADARVGEQALDRCALRLAAEQHGASMTQGARARPWWARFGPPSVDGYSVAV